jgi:uncharacterized alkaline shock family protein YloU
MEDNYNMGTIKISEEVIATIAYTAACEVDGVAKVHPKMITNAKNFINNLRPSIKGISISTTPEGIELALQLTIKNGYKIPDVATKVQDNVSDAIQNMTGLKVNKVNIIITNIVLEKSEADE